MERIYLSPPDMGAEERELLLEAFDSNWIAPLGPHVDAFERELGEVAGGADVAALSSGTAALHLGLELLGVQRGDRVYVSTLTFAASVNAIRYRGAEPVFIDATRSTWNLDPDLLRETLERDAKAGRLPKAVMVVDLYGQCADYDPILEACRAHGVPVLEDAAEALGASYRGRPAGSLGDIAVFSFNGNKIITTSGGGALVSANAEWVERARFLASQAREPAPHYEHEVVGYNYRLSNLLAAVGRGQLRGLAAKVAARRANFDAYRRALRGVAGSTFMPEADYGTSTRWLTCLTVRDTATRDGIIAALGAANIEARPVWKPMHAQPVFQGFESIGGDVADELFATGLCLPSGSSLSDAQRKRVIDTFLASVPKTSSPQPRAS